MLLSATSCSEEDEKPSTPPTAEFSFTPVSPKVNEEVTFNNTSTNATSYKWSATGTSLSSTEKNPIYKPHKSYKNLLPKIMKKIPVLNNLTQQI